MECYKPITDDGNILPPSNEVYSRISEAMSEKKTLMSSKHIYTHLRENRCGTLGIVKKFYGLDNPKYEDHNKENDSLFDISKTSSKGETKHHFKLFVSYRNWCEMRPNRRRMIGQKYMNFNDPWPNIISECVWDQEKIRCCFIFKIGRVSITNQARYYARFKAECKECNAVMKGRLHSKPANQKDAIFDCTVINYKPNINHIKKRPLRGALRQKLASTLVGGRKHASTWRNEEACNIMAFGDPMPPTMYSGDVLRKAKQEEADKMMSLMFPEPISNLVHAKHFHQQNVIRPFLLHLLF